ncbi:MAG: glycerate kinase [Propionibacteriales bacterium]|nr:glycerate kinase [Propionibacteriales bacterium]
MRVLFAPDSFGGTLTAVEAAAAMAQGWGRRAPDDELVLVPMSDGGPGFVDVLHAGLGGDVLSGPAIGLYGDEVPTGVLIVEDTAYVESAQACGLSLSQRRDPERATSYGVGQMIAAAIDDGAQRVVVGLGGSGSNDAGAGALAALGATSTPPKALLGGPHALELLTAVDLEAARDRCSGVELVVASDVDNPLLGLRGATNVYGPQKGVAPDRLQHVDAQLERLATCTDRALADSPGAGAAGGLGFALLLLGASRVGGVTVVAEAVGLTAQVRASDLVVTGEGAFDFQSRSGKVPYGVARMAVEAIRPCIALAGQVLVGSREMRALGIESAYSIVDLVGRDAAMGEPVTSLATLAERVARTWSR